MTNNFEKPSNLDNREKEESNKKNYFEEIINLIKGKATKEDLSVILERHKNVISQLKKEGFEEPEKYFLVCYLKRNGRLSFSDALKVIKEYNKLERKIIEIMKKIRKSDQDKKDKDIKTGKKETAKKNKKGEYKKKKKKIDKKREKGVRRVKEIDTEEALNNIINGIFEKRFENIKDIEEIKRELKEFLEKSASDIKSSVEKTHYNDKYNYLRAIYFILKFFNLPVQRDVLRKEFKVGGSFFYKLVKDIENVKYSDAPQEVQERFKEFVVRLLKAYLSIYKDKIINVIKKEKGIDFKESDLAFLEENVIKHLSDNIFKVINREKAENSKIDIFRIMHILVEVEIYYFVNKMLIDKNTALFFKDLRQIFGAKTEYDTLRDYLYILHEDDKEGIEKIINHTKKQSRVFGAKKAADKKLRKERQKISILENILKEIRLEMDESHKQECLRIVEAILSLDSVKISNMKSLIAGVLIIFFEKYKDKYGNIDISSISKTIANVIGFKNYRSLENRKIEIRSIIKENNIKI